MICPTIYIANTSMLRLVIVPAVYAVMTNVPYGMIIISILVMHSILFRRMFSKFKIETFSSDLMLINAIPSRTQKIMTAGIALLDNEAKGFDGINKS